MSEAESCSEVSETCPVELSLYGYRPNMAANTALAAGFALFLILEFGSLCCFRVRTWSFTFTLAIGTILEALGYVGRILMNRNPFSTLGLSVQLIALIVAPSFVSAAMSVTFKHIIVYCGAQYSWMRPRFIPWFMIGTDFVGIVIQFLGSAVLAMEVTRDEPRENRVDLGNNIIIFGVVFQAFIMVVCGAYMVWFGLRFRADSPGRGGSSNFSKAAEGVQLLPKGSYEVDRRTNGSITFKFKAFCWAIVFAFLAVLARCVYRCVEMISGWGSSVMRHELSFLGGDGLMILLAVAALTIFQPGFWFAPMMRRNKQRQQWDNVHRGSGEPLRDVSPAPPSAAAAAAASGASSYWHSGNQSGAQRYEPLSAQPQPYQPYGGAAPQPGQGGTQGYGYA